jgi:hypothetical protein
MKEFDNYILEKTGNCIYGMFPIKLALIMQKVFQACDFRRVANFMIVGEPSSGKSFSVSNYSCLLNGFHNKFTQGISVSVPAFRGTSDTLSYMGRDFRSVTIGYLGLYHTIIVDEAGQNTDLVNELKTFLCTDTYSYDRKGSTNTSHKRIAHVNITQNILPEHIGAYRGRIRKMYQNLTVKIGNDEKIEWQEEWDLELPLRAYDNPYLYKVIKDMRMEYQKKGLFWVDGYENALHQRFPFYFFVSANKKCDERTAIVRKNTSRNPSSIPDTKLSSLLASDNIYIWFNDLNSYIQSETDEVSFEVIDKIVDEYQLGKEDRIHQFYQMLGKASRIINHRRDMNEQDFNFVRYIIENTDCKIETADTAQYVVHGPAGTKKLQEMEEKTSHVSNPFGISLDEFGR